MRRSGAIVRLLQGGLRMADSELPPDKRMVSFPVNKKRKRPTGVSLDEPGISDTTIKRIYSAMAKKAQEGDVAAAKFCEQAWKDRKARELMNSGGGTKAGVIDMTFAKD